MFTRYLTSAPLGIAVTLSLLYVMQFLIELGPGPDLTPRKIFDGVFLQEEIKEVVRKIESKAEHIDPPQPLPPIQPREDYLGEVSHTGYFAPIPQITEPGPTTTFIGRSDGPLVNVLTVGPNYPITASQKRLEGWVIVRFDVTALGTVENVVVIGTSHAVFNKPAKAAASRFRFKPRVVNGVALPVQGLMNKFVFRMET
jgi:protein TonB